MPQFELIQADDWEVLLKDGKIIEEGHTVPNCICLPCCLDLIEKEQINSSNFTHREATEEEYIHLEEYGSWKENNDAK